MKTGAFEAVTITLNPAIDRTVTIGNFAAGAVNRVEQASDSAGGKGVNVAAALADYGVRVAVTGFLGKENSAPFEALFARKNIEDRFVRIEGLTRVGIKVADPILKQTTDINFPGPAPSAKDLKTLRERLATMDGEWFVLAGSLPPAVDAGIYREIISELKARGCKVALDASGEALREGLKAGPDIVKPNIDELGTLLGKTPKGESELVDAGRWLIANGAELAVISMGSDGACFVTASEVVIARPPKVEVRSTVGAGDAMLAGILAGRLQKFSLADCARLSTAFAVGALTLSEAGAVSPASVEAMMAQVEIRPLRPA